ncbi:hypothetical protein K461DRAFT_292875 [Myriangium duriaei CBS 260.36]|uniref:Uncharacterized protein n=1 Tax=Myriangium duriaei CBS 260.36 TaxID=1168546 RepID=A0A9P4J6Q4_9PEZI|nr:hypothetical protein K461DRAFT_292875 [Myriangium duriaei CBS 260.36]
MPPKSISNVRSTSGPSPVRRRKNQEDSSDEYQPSEEDPSSEDFVSEESSEEAMPDLTRKKFEPIDFGQSSEDSDSSFIPSKNAGSSNRTPKASSDPQRGDQAMEDSSPEAKDLSGQSSPRSVVTASPWSTYSFGSNDQEPITNEEPADAEDPVDDLHRLEAQILDSSDAEDPVDDLRRLEAQILDSSDTDPPAKEPSPIIIDLTNIESSSSLDETESESDEDAAISDVSHSTRTWFSKPRQSDTTAQSLANTRKPPIEERVEGTADESSTSEPQQPESSHNDVASQSLPNMENDKNVNEQVQEPRHFDLLVRQALESIQEFDRLWERLGIDDLLGSSQHGTSDQFSPPRSLPSSPAREVPTLSFEPSSSTTATSTSHSPVSGQPPVPHRVRFTLQGRLLNTPPVTLPDDHAQFSATPSPVPSKRKDSSSEPAMPPKKRVRFHSENQVAESSVANVQNEEKCNSETEIEMIKAFADMGEQEWRQEKIEALHQDLTLQKGKGNEPIPTSIESEGAKSSKSVSEGPDTDWLTQQWLQSNEAQDWFVNTETEQRRHVPQRESSAAAPSRRTSPARSPSSGEEPAPRQANPAIDPRLPEGAVEARARAYVEETNRNPSIMSGEGYDEATLRAGREEADRRLAMKLQRAYDAPGTRAEREEFDGQMALKLQRESDATTRAEREEADRRLAIKMQQELYGQAD